MLHILWLPFYLVRSVKIMFIDADNNRFPVDGICGETLFQTAQRYHVNYRRMRFHDLFNSRSSKATL